MIPNLSSSFLITTMIFMVMILLWLIIDLLVIGLSETLPVLNYVTTRIGSDDVSIINLNKTLNNQFSALENNIISLTQNINTLQSEIDLIRNKISLLG